MFVDTLTDIVFDTSCLGKQRATALDELAGSTSATITELLVRVTEIDELEVQVSAAFNLAHLDVLRRVGLLAIGDKYVDGYAVAKVLGVSMDPDDQ